MRNTIKDYGLNLKKNFVEFGANTKSIFGQKELTTKDKAKLNKKKARKMSAKKRRLEKEKELIEDTFRGKLPKYLRFSQGHYKSNGEKKMVYLGRALSTAVTIALLVAAGELTIISFGMAILVPILARTILITAIGAYGILAIDRIFNASAIPGVDWAMSILSNFIGDYITPLIIPTIVVYLIARLVINILMAIKEGTFKSDISSLITTIKNKFFKNVQPAPAYARA